MVCVEIRVFCWGPSNHQAVLMEISIKHVFAINPAAANFTCEFEVRSLRWMIPLSLQRYFYLYSLYTYIDTNVTFLLYIV